MKAFAASIAVLIVCIGIPLPRGFAQELSARSNHYNPEFQFENASSESSTAEGGEMSPPQMEPIDPVMIAPEVIANPDNVKKPNFRWAKLDQVTNYQLYVKNELIYSGEGSQFPPNDTYPYEEFAYGLYQVYVIAMLKNGTRVRGKAVDFIIGIAKPALLVLKDQEETYVTKPKFKWTPVPGAEWYEIYLDNILVYKGNEVSYKHPSALDFGRHDWVVQAKNKIQHTRSNRGIFKVKSIPGTHLLSPQDGYSEVIFTKDQLPSLTWEPVILEGESEPVLYELYLDSTKIYDGKETEFRFPQMLDYGSHAWLVIAKIFDQKASPSETWYFKAKRQWWVNIGLKGGTNLMKTTNDVSKIKPQLTVGPYLDKRILLNQKFELRAEIDSFYEIRNVGFKREDNLIYQADDLHIQSYNLTVPIGIKPQYIFNEHVTIYGVFGAQMSFGLYSIIQRESDRQTQFVRDQINSVFVDLVTCVGTDVTFDVKYLFGQPLTLSLEFRFTYGFLNHLNQSYLGGSDNATQYSFLLGNKIFAF